MLLTTAPADIVHLFDDAGVNIAFLFQGLLKRTAMRRMKRVRYSLIPACI
jgi:hypothetical protein